MTLIGAIIKQVQSLQSLKSRATTNREFSLPRSPPPELEVIEVIEKAKKLRARKKLCKYGKTLPKVDARPPRFHARHLFKKVPEWIGMRERLAVQNLDVVTSIKNAQMSGRVDSRWRNPPKSLMFAYESRVNTMRRITHENKLLHKRLLTQGPKVDTTQSLMKDWARNREDILSRATETFVLFPPIPTEDIEDPAFVKPPGVKRPRVYFTLHLEGHAKIGELQAELFPDICPQTCGLFTDLLCGDGVGFSYVNTHFFRKVPELYWAGGDVARDNGFGCYAQKGRRVPIGAENYHFSHSIPGLLSMTVTCDDEMCGIFYITFKPLPQLDLKNVVFGRIIRPSEIFNGITCMGTALSSRPLITLSASRMKVDGKWIHGTPNTRVVR